MAFQGTLDSGGRFCPDPMMLYGRPYPAGPYLVSIETLPFEFGVQEDWIVDAVGEHGKALPHSATEPIDLEFPQHGRRVVERLIVDFPPAFKETRWIETVKRKSFRNPAGTQSPRAVEDILRERFTIRLDERPMKEPWKVEQNGEDRWIVSFAFECSGRPQVAQWETNAASGEIRYLDPEAKAIRG